MFALQLAAALRAEKLILMTDVPGVMRDKDDISTKYAELDIRETRQAGSSSLRSCAANHLIALHLLACCSAPFCAWC
jgi:acetylglutamate kinase